MITSRINTIGASLTRPSLAGRALVSSSDNRRRSMTLLTIGNPPSTFETSENPSGSFASFITGTFRLALGFTTTHAILRLATERHDAPEETPPMPEQQPNAHDERTAIELTGLDYALPGTLATRFMRCGKENCRCKADPPILHGPYLHWTRTVASKTVTRTLTPDQAARYQAWFDNARRLRELITDLEARSLQAFNDAEN